MKQLRLAALAAPIAAMALLGAGCSNPFTKTASPASTSTAQAPGTTEATSTAIAIDDTWDSYSSKSGFTFSYPTKGRLTPEWSIDNFAMNDAKIVNGCYVDGSSERANSRAKMTVGNTEFCVTRTADPGAGQVYYADNYAFVNGKNISVITFTKHFTNGSNYDREECHGKTVVPVGATDCATFEEGDYNKLLDTSIKTFKKD
ncbi:MAG: hypothetical protein U0487_01775 [Patescibacteria group bacterium]